MTFGLIALTDFRVETADTAKARRSGNRTSDGPGGADVRRVVRNVKMRSWVSISIANTFCRSPRRSLSPACAPNRVDARAGNRGGVRRNRNSLGSFTRPVALHTRIAVSPSRCSVARASLTISATISPAGCDRITSPTPCPAQIDSASMSPSTSKRGADAA